MRPFAYQRADDCRRDPRGAGAGRRGPPTEAPAQFLAGGTTLLDLMKLDVMRPGRAGGHQRARAPRSARIERDADGLRLGAFVRMAEAADASRRSGATIPSSRKRSQLAASAQTAQHGDARRQRAAAHALQLFPRSVAGRPATSASPARGCAALDGVNRKHAVLGVSDALHRDLSRRFRAGAGRARRDGRDRRRRAAAARPCPSQTCTGCRATRRTSRPRCAPGELITAFIVPAEPWTRRSLYLKIRDRQSYEFALASAAVALDLDGDKVREARIALGGVATKPWRAREAEAALAGKALDEAVRPRGARAAFASARGPRRQRLQGRARPAHPGARAAAGGAHARPEQARLEDRWPTPQHRSRATWASPPAHRRAAKVTGEARYASDCRSATRPIAFLVTSAIAKRPHRRASISPQARAVPGVLDILTHENIGRRIKAVSLRRRRHRHRPRMPLRPRRSGTTARSSPSWSPNLRGGARRRPPAARRLRRGAAERRPSTRRADRGRARPRSPRSTRIRRVGDAEAALRTRAA